MATRCPDCGAEAYVGLSVVECTSEECRNYSPVGKEKAKTGTKDGSRYQAFPGDGLREEDLGFMTVECAQAMTAVTSLQSTLLRHDICIFDEFESIRNEILDGCMIPRRVLDP